MPTHNTLVIALRTTVVTLLVTGLAYPLLVTGLAQVLFPAQAKGSLVRDDRERVVGSKLIAQAFADPSHFHSRPSAAGENGYDATSSSGSNLGPTSRKLRDRVRTDAERLLSASGTDGPIPAELVTTSASGLDPHLSPEAAMWQIPRIARARGIAPEKLRALVEERTEGRELGLLGEPRVNVLLLNMSLTSLGEGNRK